MVDPESSLLLTRLIAIGYLPGFLADPVGTAQKAVPLLGLDFDGIIFGMDFKGMFGQERVPYGVVALGASGTKYVAFRGTDSVEEWLEDGFAVPEPWPFNKTAGLHTHKGFSDVYQTLILGKDNALDALQMTGPVVVTGHSLGGALAYLLGAALGPLASQVVTFESPRVGDLAFCTWMDSRVPNHFRYVIIGDVVPHAPPEILGYYHAGTEIDMNPAGVIPLTLDPKVYLSSHHVLSSVQALLAASP